MPAVLNGALGVNPTCCGVSPYYEVFTGSANVLIEGERAVRMLDLTFHCQAAPLSGRHPRLRRTLHGAQQALHGEHKVEDVADFAEQNAAAMRPARRPRRPGRAGGRRGGGDHGQDQ